MQRVFSSHAAAAWAGAVGFFVTAVCGAGYLLTSRRAWDAVAVSSMEVSLAFMLMTTLSGPVWAQFAWGKPWVWDPRLTTVAVMILIYAAGLMLRSGLEDPDRRARLSAVYGMVAFFSVILTFVSVRIWRTIHPAVVGAGSGDAAGGFKMSARMLHTLLFSNLVYTLLYVTLVLHRLRLEKNAWRVAALRQR